MINLLSNLNLLIVLAVLGVSLYLLSKAADILVDNAVILSNILGLPEIVVGATIVSLGTTLPEISASVTSALKHNSTFALGNAVGSIITNTSFVIGIGALFGKFPVDRKASQKLSLLIAATFLLILPTIPYRITGKVGIIPQWMGIVFLFLIPIYIYFLISQEKNKNIEKSDDVTDSELKKPQKSIMVIALAIFLSIVVIAFSAAALVGSAEVLAEKIGIPDIIIASTLVAFGTSVPELSTCIAAAKKNRGGLALGNILGADILNILFVLGASVALSKGGIKISQEFYNVHFIALGTVLAIFGYFAYNKKIDEISKKEGIILSVIYLAYLGVNLFHSI